MNLSTLCLAVRTISHMPGAAYMYCLAALRQALHRCNQNCVTLQMKASTAAQKHSGAVNAFGGGKHA